MAEVLKWYEKAGNHSDVVYSTRVRLARNLQQYPFPGKANAQEKAEIENKIKERRCFPETVRRQSSFLLFPWIRFPRKRPFPWWNAIL